ncbi:hypothetical protein [Cupriavidus necator]|uniref:hypothetical protein n=1 Tax=Cupriavidus necator TaxID=106590 RepID=UPI00068F1E77|nr:hypothetical protein [Cupriavidus necator]
MAGDIHSEVVQLGAYKVEKRRSSVSGLSSGAFMTVQLHLAHSSSFAGAGVIAGGPYRCAESFRAAAPEAEDAYELNALHLCMSWLQERARIRRANSVSKLMEQEFDLLARFVLLLSDQAVDLVTLQENVEVNTGYWLGQKAAAAAA